MVFWLFKGYTTCYLIKEYKILKVNILKTKENPDHLDLSKLWCKDNNEKSRNVTEVQNTLSGPNSVSRDYIWIEKKRWKLWERIWKKIRWKLFFYSSFCFFFNLTLILTANRINLCVLAPLYKYHIRNFKFLIFRL